MKERHTPLPHLNRRQLEIDGLTSRAALLIDQDWQLHRRYWEHCAITPHRPWAELHAYYSLKLEGMDLVAASDGPDGSEKGCHVVNPQAAALTLMSLHCHHSKDYEPCHWWNEHYIQSLYRELVAVYTSTCQVLKHPAPPPPSPLAIIPQARDCNSPYDGLDVVHLTSIHLLLYTLNVGHLLVGPFVRLFTELAFGSLGVTGCAIWGIPQTLYPAKDRYHRFLSVPWSTDLRPQEFHDRLQAFADWFLGRIRWSVNHQLQRLDQVRHP